MCLFIPECPWNHSGGRYIQDGGELRTSVRFYLQTSVNQFIVLSWKIIESNNGKLCYFDIISFDTMKFRHLEISPQPNHLTNKNPHFSISPCLHKTRLRFSDSTFLLVYHHTVAGSRFKIQIWFWSNQTRSWLDCRPGDLWQKSQPPW